MKRKIGLVALALAITGCAPIQPKVERDSRRATPLLDKNVVASLEKVKDKKASELSDSDREKLQAALANLEASCSDKLSGLESESKAQAKNAFLLSVAGALAGSVIVPALTVHAATNAGAIAGFGGFAGATNFMSQSLASSGNSGSAVATTRNNIVNAIQTHLADAFNEQKNIGDRMTAIDAAKASCVFYAIFVPSATTYTAPAPGGGGSGN